MNHEPGHDEAHATDGAGIAAVAAISCGRMFDVVTTLPALAIGRSTGQQRPERADHGAGAQR
jgi:hypothetical protein